MIAFARIRLRVGTLTAVAALALSALCGCSSAGRGEPALSRPHPTAAAEFGATGDSTASLPPSADLMRGDQASGMAGEDAGALRLRPVASQPAAPASDVRRPRLNVHRRLMP